MIERCNGSADTRRRRNRHCGDCVSGFHWRGPLAREAGAKCRTGCCSKREKQNCYSAYPRGGHGTQPVAKIVRSSAPPKINDAPIGLGNQVRGPESAIRKSTTRTRGRPRPVGGAYHQF
jgi:hypothetical protein